MPSFLTISIALISNLILSIALHWTYSYFSRPRSKRSSRLALEVLWNPYHTSIVIFLALMFSYISLGYLDRIGITASLPFIIGSTMVIATWPTVFRCHKDRYDEETELGFWVDIMNSTPHKTYVCFIFGLFMLAVQAYLIINAKPQVE